MERGESECPPTDATAREAQRLDDSEQRAANDGCRREEVSAIHQGRMRRLCYFTSVRSNHVRITPV